MPIAAGVAPVIAVAARGKSSGGSLVTLIDASKNWPVDVWRGCALNLFVGDILVTHRISSNTATVLTFQAASVAVVAGTDYFIVGNVSIQAADVTIAAQVAGVYLQPEWANLQQLDMNFNYPGVNVATGGNANGAYLVPDPRTLFITSMQTYIYAFNAVDRDQHQVFVGEAYTDSGSFTVQFGGYGGAVLDFTKSLRVDALDTVNFYIRNYANHNVNMGISIQGYQI